jgi:hypothetical protein
LTRVRSGVRRKELQTPIRRALTPQSSLHTHVRDGVGALAKAHAVLIDELVRRDLADSLNLDAALAAAHPQANRWDYLLGHGPTGRVVAMESHSARDGEVSVLIAKRAAARDQLRLHLRPGTNVAAWLWVTEGRIAFADTDKRRRQLDEAGITFVGRQVLSKHLPR